ncbi:MAG: carotenoid 1,2-hydratase, partial [Halomonadaceae bacterium]
MSHWRGAILCLSLLIIGCGEPASEQGFAGLDSADTEAADFQQPGPGDRLQFPQDFGPHPAHRIEWWYLTANLETDQGEALGLQWTQFRQALKPRSMDEPRPPASDWPLEAAWMAHGAVSFQEQHYFAEKLARGDVSQAGAIASPLQVWLDDWQLTAGPDNDRWHLQVKGDDWDYELWLSNTHDRVAHGDQGFSAKSASGEGSMYFSLVDLQIEGTVTLGEDTHEVSGQGWFDREWSSQFLKAGQQGWDWFALHLADNYKLMAFRLREGDDDFL